MTTGDESSRFVTVFHQLKESDHNKPGERYISLGKRHDDYYVMNDDLGELVPLARPIAIIDAGVEMEQSGLEEWINSHAGEAVLSQYFEEIEPSDPTLPDMDEYLVSNQASEDECPDGDAE